jgi:sec-independent protein translocase protein TatC
MIQERSRRSSRPREAFGGAAQWASASGLVEAPRVSSPPALAADRHASTPPASGGWTDPMRTEKDLFAEENQMVSMSFGDHIEDLRYRLILALIGLFVGMVITFIPLPVMGQSIGMYVFHTMERPAQQTLDQFYKDQAIRLSTEARQEKKLSPTVVNHFPAKDFVEQIVRIAPKLAPMLPDPNSDGIKGLTIDLPLTAEAGDLILNNQTLTYRSALVSLAPLETITIYFMICMVSGLVLTSPFVFYQVWAFIAAGLYRHERHYVKKFLPFSLGLFLSGVFLCFFGVLPYTLMFLLQFNVWLGIEPTMRITDWMSFATILPVVFGISFQTPLVMLFLERIGILTSDDFRKKRKIAILVMVAAAAILTPGPDVFSQLALAIPMIGLYELGLVMIDSNKPKKKAAPTVS